MMNPVAWVSAVAVGLLFSAARAAPPASSPASAPVPAPPPYSVTRWTENYAYLKNVPPSDLWDPIKFIPIGDDVSLSLGGQVRQRYELFNNAGFDAGPQDDDGYFLTRLLLSADLRLGERIRVFVEGKSALIDGRTGGPRPTDADEIDLEQLFVDVKLPLPTAAGDWTTIRFGRQYLLYGAQRLISPLDWANTRRTFEGLKLSNKLGRHELDFFVVRPVAIDRERLNDGDGDQVFSGVYDTFALPDLFGPAAGTKLEGYFLALNQTRNAIRAQDTDTYTVGSRFSSRPLPWDIDAEVDYQWGDMGAGDFDAFSFAVEGGYTFDAPLSPRASLGFDYATRDFNQLFPLGHAYFGYIDAIGRRNILDLHPGVQLALLRDRKLVKSLALRADYHLFWRADDDGAVYNAAGGVLRTDNGSDATFIGSEIDLLLTWQIDRHLQVYAGYSHFFTGDFIDRTGPGRDIDFFYAAAQYTF